MGFGWPRIVNSGKKGFFTSLGKIAQKGFDLFPPGFLVEEIQQGEAIEDKRRIHAFFPSGAPLGDRRSRRNHP